MSSSKGYWYPLFDFNDTTFSLSQMFVVSIDELLDVFEILGFIKKGQEERVAIHEIQVHKFYQPEWSSRVSGAYCLQIQREEGAFYSTWVQALQELDNKGTNSEGHSHRITARNEEHRKVQIIIRKKGGNVIERRREQVITIII